MFVYIFLIEHNWAATCAYTLPVSGGHSSDLRGLPLNPRKSKLNCLILIAFMLRWQILIGVARMRWQESQRTLFMEYCESFELKKDTSQKITLISTLQSRHSGHWS